MWRATAGKTSKHIIITDTKREDTGNRTHAWYAIVYLKERKSCLKSQPDTFGNI